jgi:hypothetical protein
MVEHKVKPGRLLFYPIYDINYAPKTREIGKLKGIVKITGLKKATNIKPT